MAKLIASEVSDFLACIEIGWAKPVPAANHRDDQCEYTFYRVGDDVFYIYYVFSSTVSEYYQVEGENLELFNIYYKQEVEA